MIRIQIENTQFDYVPAGEANLAVASIWDKPPAYSIILATGSDSRLALFRDLLSPSRRNPYWLVWQSPKDLNELDAKIKLGRIDNGDFESSLRAFHKNIVCSNCGSKFSALIIDPGDPYPGSPELHQSKISKMLMVRCPKCGGSFRQLVAKIIGDVLPEQSG